MQAIQSETFNRKESQTAMERPISDIAFTPAVKAAQEQRGSREAYARMGIALVALLATAAHARNQVWSDPILLWTDSLEKSDHVRARVNLGAAYFEAERSEDAVEHLERVVGQDARRDSAWTTLAAARTHLGRIDEAVEDYRAALRANPTNAMARSGLGGLVPSHCETRAGDPSFLSQPCPMSL